MDGRNRISAGTPFASISGVDRGFIVGPHARKFSRPSATARATRALASSTSCARASPSRSMLAWRVPSLSLSRSIFGSCRNASSALASLSVFASERTSPPTLRMPARSCCGSTSIRESTASVIVAETFSARCVTFDVATRARTAATITSMAVPLINAISNWRGNRRNRRESSLLSGAGKEGLLSCWREASSD